MPLQLPLSKIYKTQGFGVNPQIYSRFGMKGHNGWDFRTVFLMSPLGHLPCRPISDGIVLTCGFDFGGYGNYCRIQHANGSQTVYGHFSKLLVKTNQRVNQLTVLGITGSTGFSTGPHLHFGYRPPNFNINNGYKGYVDPRVIFPNV